MSISGLFDRKRLRCRSLMNPFLFFYGVQVRRHLVAKHLKNNFFWLLLVIPNCMGGGVGQIGHMTQL